MKSFSIERYDDKPFILSLVNARAHVLEFALRGLNDKARKVLETIAAFRMPASYSESPRCNTIGV